MILKLHDTYGDPFLLNSEYFVFAQPLADGGTSVTFDDGKGNSEIDVTESLAVIFAMFNAIQIVEQPEQPLVTDQVLTVPGTEQYKYHK